jgi:phospholipase D1/2
MRFILFFQGYIRYI